MMGLLRTSWRVLRHPLYFVHLLCRELWREFRYYRHDDHMTLEWREDRLRLRRDQE